MSEYTQGVCHDGAAILKDGQPLTIEQILEALRERDALAHRNTGLIQQCEATEHQRDTYLNKLRTLNHGNTSEAWHWMNDGDDQLESLTCPILISAEDLKGIFEERDALAAHLDRLYCALDNVLAEIVSESNGELSAVAKEGLRALDKDFDTNALIRRDLLQQSQGAHKVAHAVLHTNLLRSQNLDKQEYAAGVATLIGNQLYQEANNGAVPANPADDRIEFLNQQNTVLQEQNDALAAHVEAIKSAAAKNYPQEDYYAGDWISDLCQAIDSCPADLLARRDSHPDCELECGAHGSYCKCADEGHQ